MRVFTTVPTRDPADAPAVFAELEGVGYTGVLSTERGHDPFLPLALGAPATTTLQLGTGVAVAFARSPMTLAQVGHDLQGLAAGRFRLGLGSQTAAHVEQRYAMPWSRPADRMREMVQAIRTIWDAWARDVDLHFEGEFYRHTLMPPEARPAGHDHGLPTIQLGALGPEMTAVAGEVADGVLVHPFHSRRSLEEITAPALQRGCDAAGRPTEAVERLVMCLLATGETGPDLDEAVESVRRQVARHAAVPAYARVMELHGWEATHAQLRELAEDGRWDDMAAHVTDEMLETFAVVGPRGEVGKRLRERVDGLADAVAIACPGRPDPHHFADIVAGLLLG